MMVIGIILAVLLVILILAVLALIGLISTGVSILREIARSHAVLTGATSMLATTFDERCTDDESERVFFRNLRQAIYHGVVDGGGFFIRNS